MALVLDPDLPLREGPDLALELLAQPGLHAREAPALQLHHGPEVLERQWAGVDAALEVLEVQLAHEPSPWCRPPASHAGAHRGQYRPLRPSASARFHRTLESPSKAMAHQMIHLLDVLRGTWDQVAAFLPRLAVAVLLLVLGWVLARLVAAW